MWLRLLFDTNATRQGDGDALEQGSDALEQGSDALGQGSDALYIEGDALTRVMHFLSSLSQFYNFRAFFSKPFFLDLSAILSNELRPGRSCLNRECTTENRNL